MAEPDGLFDASSPIARSYEESWRLYRQSLETPRASWPHWDWVVLTAGGERQARAFEMQLAWRRRAGLLPRATQFAVVADPGGRRIGSGGATIHALVKIAGRLAKAKGKRHTTDLESLFAGKRVLILHSGGESRRLPHCAAFGKIFAHVPRELPNGRASTLLDEFLISVAGLPFRMSEGVFVASGDVLLFFDHRQIDLSRQGVVGIAARTPAELGTRHGVYVACQTDDRVRRFLHKASLEDLHTAGAVNAAGQAAIDTGMVWFDPATAAALIALFALPSSSHSASSGWFDKIITEGASLNLYSDLLMPLADETDRERYLEDTSDGIPGPTVRELRREIWERLRGTTFRVQSLSPVEFIHFGTTSEYVHAMTHGGDNRRVFGWERSVASFSREGESARGPVVLASSVSAVEGARDLCVIEDCLLREKVYARARCLLSHVWAQRPIDLPPDVIVYQLPVISDTSAGESGYVTHIYGIEDNPKMLLDSGGATFLNAPWERWLAQARVSPDDLWEGIAAEERSLWNARLFPRAKTRDESLALALWMQNPSAAAREARDRWRAAARMSSAQTTACADLRRAIRDLKELDDRVCVARFCAAVEQEWPSNRAAALLGDRAGDVRRRAGAVVGTLSRQTGEMLAVRAYKALADALMIQKGSGSCVAMGRRCEDRAFEIVARAIRAATPHPAPSRVARARRSRARPDSLASQRVIALAPARIDLAGGWSDTPPFSIEYGGTVLNAAVRVGGRLPIRAECERLARPVLVLESRDLGIRRRFARTRTVLSYADPGDPLALHKAAVVLAGLVPERRRADDHLAHVLQETLGGGLRIATEVALPQGSGLGTSSILAGALLAGLRALLGRTIEFDTIFDEALCLEQMLTTGGGWQDQVGGIVGGIKLASADPGLPQRPRIEQVVLTDAIAHELGARLVLVYAGQRRLAKGILRAIMGRFMSRDPEAVAILCGIREIAKAQRRALEAGDLDQVGRLMLEHWEMNKRLDPHTTNPLIDRLFEVCRPFMIGGKLAGAGGGGFMELIARDQRAVSRLSQRLADEFPGTDIAPWPCEIANDGLVIMH